MYFELIVVSIHFITQYIHYQNKRLKKQLLIVILDEINITVRCFAEDLDVQT